jgi:hypothetical protein
MIISNITFSRLSAYLTLSFAVVTKTTSVLALPEQVFWDNDWESDLDPSKGELLEGTVLFAQSQIIPSKHGIKNDNQPHLTALRKTLVMFNPHGKQDDSLSIELTVRDADGIIISGGQPIVMNDPEGIPRQDGWIDLGKVSVDFPSNLDNAYVVEGQANLIDIVGSDVQNDNLANIFNTVNKDIDVRTRNGSWVEEIYLPSGSMVPEMSRFQLSCGSQWGVKVHYPKGRSSSEWYTKSVEEDEKLLILLVNGIWVAETDPKPDYIPDFPSSLTNPYVVQYQQNLDVIGNDPEATGLTRILNEENNQVEIQTWDGSWVKEIYLPKGDTVPGNSVIQFTCDSAYYVYIYYPNEKTGGWRTRTVSRGDVLIFVLTSNTNVWVAAGDLGHNDYIFGNNFYTSTLDAEWVKPGMTLDFASTSGKQGILEANVGGVTELVITTLDAGFLTEPRNEFTFRDDPTTHREYFETTMASRLIVAQYEAMHLTEIMLPSGKFYNSVSDDDGGVYEGDMREYIGKILLSHGIDLANYGISSSLAQSESPHPFTCAFLAAHNSVGMYQNGRVVHGLSGGNGMITLYDSIGNEMSHEIGHNYELGHFVDGFEGSVHRAANEINSSWGWDSQRNIFFPNFSPTDSGLDQCLDEQCQSPFLGKYRYGTDAMAGGDPLWGSNRFTMYTPNTSKIIQDFLENKAVFDPTSSTGFRKYHPSSRQMKEFYNSDNGNKVPRLYRVPVTTIVGYYDPDPNRGINSWIYPAMHGAYGFVYNDEGGSSTGTSNGCELVVKTKKTTLVYRLGTSIDPKGMTKFHVNIATEDEPSFASLYCQNRLLKNRVLEGPKVDEPPLTFTVNGVPFDHDEPTDSPVAAPPPTDYPTDYPTAFPSNAPTDGSDPCKDRDDLKYGKKKRNCKWVGKGKRKKVRKKCRRKFEKVKIFHWCPTTCGKVGLGNCKK